MLRFEAKITKAKRSGKFEAKISEKREVKFYSEIVKHVKRIQFRFISLYFALFRFISLYFAYKRKFFSAKRAHPKLYFFCVLPYFTVACSQPNFTVASDRFLDLVVWETAFCHEETLMTFYNTR